MASVLVILWIRPVGDLVSMGIGATLLLAATVVRRCRQVRPILLGVAVGEFLAGGVWGLIDALTGTLRHSILPEDV